MLIYVAGPYSAPTEAERIDNVEQAMGVGDAILELGHYPVIPHLTHYFDEWAAATYGERPPYEMYLKWDMELLNRCDALYFILSSPGADRELARAQELGIPVYHTLYEIPGAA